MIALLDYCGVHAAETLQTLEALAAIESPSTDADAADRCGTELASRLTAMGATVERHDAPGRGRHVSARFTGNGAPILLLGHFDTVWPVGTLARMPIRREGGRLFGPGVFDMKAGIAIAMTAVAALHAVEPTIAAIQMLWTSDEEVGSESSRALIESAAREARAVLVLEPALPGGALKTSRKGCGQFELTVEGVSAHAGLDPGAGVSAIHELAAQILKVEAFQDLERGVSVNVGVVQGGSRANVVAERATAIVDVRAPDAREAARIESDLRNLQPARAGARLTIRGGFERPPLERTDAVVRLFEAARAVAASFGHTLHEGSAGGGSDGNFTAALGIPTLDGLGAVGNGAHAAGEHVEIDALPQRAALVAGLLGRIGN
jgi:glutamate carboxypeptidase